MHLLSNLLAVSVLLLCLGSLVGLALSERPLATCARCRRSFDSLPAFNAHAIEGCDQ
jgi:hypothetical protein